MATYYRCVQGDAARADTIFKEHVVPYFNAEKGAGRITGFGWAKHWSGGDWRRLFYFSGNDPDKLLDTYLGLIKMAESAQHAKAMDEFDRVCSSHDDYTWRSKSGPKPARAAGVPGHLLSCRPTTSATQTKRRLTTSCRRSLPRS
jgi:hypothetical protein